MLSFGKLAGGRDAGRYYEEAVARGREDYYAGEGEAPGYWVGAGAASIGLQGTVEDGQVGHLLAGEDPGTGALLGRKITEGGVAGFDLTFKAPKSVGILFGIGEAEIARVLRECHETAIGDALGYLEREACRARRGKDGLLQVQGNGFVAAAFGHRTSRAGDPLLHTHVVVANRVQGPDGRWTALDARPVYRHAKTAGCLYQARLRHEVTERLGLEWGEVHKGSAELAGFSRELVKHFSQRRAEIVEELDRRGERSLLAAQTAALATRKGKDYGVPMERLRDEWRARAAEHGLDRDRCERLLDREPRQLSFLPEPVDPSGLLAATSTFTRRDVVQAVAAAHRVGASASTIEAEVDAVLSSRQVVRIAVPGEELRYTTIDQVRLERELLECARDRQSAGVGRARADLTEQAIARRSLSDEQAELVRKLTSSGRGVEMIRAPAGAGKTFALDTAREAWARSGIKVTGCALSARAAAELREQAAIETTTIARLKLALVHGHPLADRGVLIVDEAGMVGSRDLAELARHANERNVKLVLVGDERQLPEIEAGGAFRVLAERCGALELREVRRQRERWDRDALRDLRDGRVENWARSYADADRLVTRPTSSEVRQQLTDDWWQARERGDDALMVALRRRDAADLNERARERMREAGRLRSDDVELGPRAFAEGDRVLLGRNDRRLEVVNGDRGEVIAVGTSHVDVRLDRGQEVRVPASYADEGHLDHGYAVTAHRVQGATVDRTFVLGSEELYREWGYTALTRHRDSAQFYVTAPDPFLNRPAVGLRDKEELVEAVVRTFDDSRKQELALEAIERDPQAVRAVRELERAEERARADERRRDELQQEREQTPWYRRAERRELDSALGVDEQIAATSAARVEELREGVERVVAAPSRASLGEPARDPLADLDRLERLDRRDRLDRAARLARDLPDRGLDIGP
jgi:conjugative relaxase-like TrwC/TraI family protein